MRPSRAALWAVITAALLSGITVMRADNREDEISTLRDQIRQLDQKLRVLERKQEIKDEDSAAAAKTAPKVNVSDKGISFTSADGANTIKIRALVQFDSRLFFGDEAVSNNSFLLRRARLISEGTFAKNYSYQLVPEFGGTSAPSILDANVTVAFSPEVQLKAGKFKVPVGLELLQSDSWTFFNERALPTNLVPNRDIGIQLGGDVAAFDGSVNYAVGIFNGVGDGASSTNADFDSDKDIAARVLATPFKNSADSFVSGLSVGVAGSVGREKTASALTGGYKTDGQQTFFKYKTTTIGDGENWRLSPQLDYRAGPFGLISEYVLSVVNVRPSATGAKAELKNKSWQVAAGYVITGEDSSFNGVTPKTNFDLAAGTWGAFEVVARAEKLSIDKAAFPVYADPTTSANDASTYGLGLNWYLSKVVRTSFDYYTTKFDNTVATSSSLLLRQDEKVFISRLQISF